MGDELAMRFLLGIVTTPITRCRAERARRLPAFGGAPSQGASGRPGTWASRLCKLQLGAPVIGALSHPFFLGWEGSPTKID